MVHCSRLYLVVTSYGCDAVALPIHRTCGPSEVIGISQLGIIPVAESVPVKVLEPINFALGKVIDLKNIYHIFDHNIGCSDERRLWPRFWIILQVGDGENNGSGDSPVWVAKGCLSPQVLGCVEEYRCGCVEERGCSEDPKQRYKGIVRGRNVNN